MELGGKNKFNVPLPRLLISQSSLPPVEPRPYSTNIPGCTPLVDLPHNSVLMAGLNNLLAARKGRNQAISQVSAPEKVNSNSNQLASEVEDPDGGPGSVPAVRRGRLFASC